MVDLVRRNDFAAVRSPVDDALQDRVLEDLEEARNYRRWLVELCQPHLGTSVLEIGSGSGAYTEEWAATPTRVVTASEADPSRVAELQARLGRRDNVNVRQLALPTTERASYDSIVGLNVLEHIEDDHAALSSLFRLLRPGGSLVLVVPAFSFAMSRFDRAVGHHRRYRTRQLHALATKSGFEIAQLKYVNSLGLVAWFFGMRVLRMTPRAGAILTFWDSVVIPVLRRIERGRRPPFGQSVLLVAHRPEQGMPAPASA